MEHLFQFEKRKTDFKTEIVAGITTYCAMIYIVSVISNMMIETGMQEEAAISSVLLASGFGCIIMGLLANYPIGLAPSLGVTALLSSTICDKMGYSWQAGLCAVFVEGILFFVFAVSGARRSILMSIPGHLRTAISAGIGFFLTFSGLKNSGIIVSDSRNLVALGKIYNIEVFITLFGLVVIMGLVVCKRKYAVMKGMILTVVAGLIANQFFPHKGLPSLSATHSFLPFTDVNFGAFVKGFPELFSSVNVVFIVLSLFFVDVFDSTGTLLSIVSRSKFKTVNGEPENLNRALASDALGSIVGAVLGATTISSYIESEVGITSGGRTGLTAVTTGVLFVLSVFLSPIFQLMTVCVTAPVLIVVGTLLVRQLGKIDWNDYVQAASGFATIVMMVFTYSIADGIAFGFIIYGVTALFSGRYKEVSPLMWAMIALFGIYFLMI